MACPNESLSFPGASAESWEGAGVEITPEGIDTSVFLAPSISDLGRGGQ